MNRLIDRLSRARDDRRLALGVYLPGGYPSAQRFQGAVLDVFEAGADILEVSMPGPASPHDGPVVREACRIGSASVADVSHTLRLAAEARPSNEQALVALAHHETLLGIGTAGLIDRCASYGIDGALIPDCSMQRQLEIDRYARTVGVEQVLFVHQYQDLVDLARADLDEPVIYLQSSAVCTGGGFDYESALHRLRAVRALLGSGAFVMVGFGVRGAREAEAIAATTADAVVIGTAVVEAVARGGGATTDLVRATVAASARGARTPWPDQQLGSERAVSEFPDVATA